MVLSPMSLSMRPGTMLGVSSATLAQYKFAAALPALAYQVAIMLVE